MIDKQKKEKIFLNAMDSWFSNFIIETFRTDHLPESKLQTEFMGTLNDEENVRLPLHFSPHIYSFDFNPSYKNELFNNDIFIYDLNTGNIKEVEYILRGLKSIRVESEKVIILISNIMTWAKTPNKIKSDNPDEVIFVHPDDVQLEQQKNTKVENEGNKNGEEQNEENKENNENNEEQNNLEEKKEQNENNEKKENENIQESKEIQPQVKEQSVNNEKSKEDEDDDNNEEIEGFKNEPEHEELKIERLKGDIKTYDRSIKVILIGDSGVGKTNILNRLVNNTFNDKHEPSLSLEYNNHSIKINSYIIRMQIWDTAGQEKYNSIISNYYKSAEVAVFVYSINDIKSYNSIQEWYKELINEKNDENNNVKKILLGNKLDLEKERQVEFNMAKTFANDNGFEVFAEITCKNDNEQKLYNISNIFDAIGKIFYDEYSQSSGNNLSSFHYFASPSILDSKKTPENEIENIELDKKKGCCRCTLF